MKYPCTGDLKSKFEVTYSFFMGINSLSVYTSVLRPHSVLYLNYVAFMLFHRNMESACHKNNKGFRYVKDTQCNPNL